MLSNNKPWMKDPCGRVECEPCKTKPGFCKIAGITYQIECQECKEKGIKAIYIGETNRTYYDRALNHRQALKNKDSSYGIVRHWKDVHPNLDEPPRYNFTQLKRHKTCLERQIFEALAIEGADCQTLMNGKGEWGRNLIPRLQNLPDDEFTNCQSQSQDKKGGQTTSKRNALGFTKTPSENPQQELNQRQHIVIHTETFEGQYRQRKKQRLETQRQEQSDPDPQINCDPQKANVKRSRKKAPS